MRKIRKRDAAPLFLIFLSMVSLFIIGSDAKGYDHLFFACSKIDATAPIEKAAELDLTYETISESAGIKILSTNHAYSRIMGYKMISGSFFTQIAQEEKRKNVVLNEKSAFESFGSFDVVGTIYKINGEPYVIVGVMDDKQDEKNAYIPANTVSSNFLVVMDTEEKAIADLKSLGVYENNFHLVNISEISKVVQDKTWLALMITAVFLLIVLLRKMLMQILSLAKRLKYMLHEKYWSELIKTAEMRQFMIFATIAVIETITTIWMFLKSFEIVLGWTKYAGALKGIASLAFGGKVQLLQSLCLYSDMAFCFFMLFLILFFVLTYRASFGK